MTAPVPWCLAWRDDGELAPQDRFDLLQTLICAENPDVQGSLVVAVERLSVAESHVSVLGDVTGLCA
ncbi:MAG: hypothetical protein VKK98_03495 [Cyanobacteriota bacterium]|nr:hypothetical protein [Cyanobacteriota bacterium]